MFSSGYLALGMILNRCLFYMCQFASGSLDGPIKYQLVYLQQIRKILVRPCLNSELNMVDQLAVLRLTLSSHNREIKSSHIGISHESAQVVEKVSTCISILFFPLFSHSFLQLDCREIQLQHLHSKESCRNKVILFALLLHYRSFDYFNTTTKLFHG